MCTRGAIECATARRETNVKHVRLRQDKWKTCWGRFGELVGKFLLASEGVWGAGLTAKFRAEG
jgi:hypothetical protein